MTRTTLVASGTTWLDSSNPARTFFAKTGYAALHNSNPTRWGVTYFAWPFGPDQTDGANVLKATLRLRTRKLTGTGSRAIRTQLIDQPFTIRNLTWNNRPTKFRGSTVSLSKSGALPENAVWDIDVTAMMQSVADGGSFFGFVLTTDTNAETISLQGAMSSALNPQLIVDWTYAPKPPDSLAPSAGRVVGVQKPILRWSFFDHAGDSEKLAAVQVQTSTTGNFSSPSWDSGEVPTHWCSMDLADTTFPAPAAGATTYWRVRNKDAAGLWSAWSIATSWVYRPEPVVTLQNPSPATPFVVDPTPPIDWTVTGGTQAAWRVGIYVKDPRGKWGLQEASGYRKGTETKWVPTKPLRYREATYKVTVDVFDAYNREATPGDPGYASDSEDFTFKPDADTTSPYNLTAVSGYPLPHVTLTWDHPQQPDEWIVYRDGVFLARYPGDALLAKSGAPHYTITDRWVPNGPHSWRVHAMVNGESWPSGTVTLDAEHLGTWLVDEETQKAVCIQNDDTHDMKFGEVSHVQEVLGASKVVLITEALRGYEGTVSGGLYDARGLTYGGAKGWRDNLLAFKSNPGKEYRLLIEDRSFPVQIKDVQVTGDPDRWGEWLASFSFWQMGELDFDPNVAGEA